MTEFDKTLHSEESDIAGLLFFDLTVRGDNRGWFKENWQREKMQDLGLGYFNPLQNNISFNQKTGVTRGLHAEPWDKFISVGSGSVFGAWCDVRASSPTFGQCAVKIITPDTAVFVPRGVANGFQVLEDETVYCYLVNDHWSAQGDYSAVNVADPALGIEWPVPLSVAELSEKDKHNPLLIDATPIPPKKILITGAGGQLALTLSAEFPDAEIVGRHEFDITDPTISSARRWRDYQTIINCAAYTQVDAAESTGRTVAWATNAQAVANLAKIAQANDLTFVHISSDYVFDGSSETAYAEDAELSPLGVYGQTKAAGDLAAQSVDKHYVVRTSWVIGEGKNFVNTMSSLADKGVKPAVVNDQIGRLSFTRDIAAGIRHLLREKPDYGVYNLTNSGEPASWAEVARKVFELRDRPADSVTEVSTTEYFKGNPAAAPRPLNSILDLSKITATGFTPPTWVDRLGEFLTKN